MVRQRPGFRPRVRDGTLARDAARGPRTIHRRIAVLLRRGAGGIRAARGGDVMTFNLASGLEGKRVLVTGGAGGIGREVVLAFGAAGARVAVLDLDQEKVNSVVAEMQAGSHLPLAADLRPVAGHAGIIAAVVEIG